MLKSVDYTLPEATVKTLDVGEVAKEGDVVLSSALNFKADEVREEQLKVYGQWYADFVLTVNKDVTLNIDGSADGYLAGQYDSWSKLWVMVPSKATTLRAGEGLRIMETAAELLGKPGLKFTYGEIYEIVKDFNCGIYFNDEFLLANADLEVTLELRLYNPANEEEYIVIGDTYNFQFEPSSVDKFVSNDNLSFELGNNGTVEKKLGEIFAPVEGANISSSDITLTISGDNCIYTKNEDDWTQSTLMFTGAGEVLFVISDNNHCREASATITITEPVQVVKFETKLENTDKYLYKVGNMNEITLGTLFEAAEGVEIGNVSVSVSPSNAAEGVMLLSETADVEVNLDKNASNWTDYKLKFTGAGVVNLTITDDDGCIATTIPLDVVDAMNATTKMDAKSNNVVLLNDISGGFSVSNGYAFYGNGFKVINSGNGSYGSKDLKIGFITVTKGGILDNVQVIYDVYPEAYIYGERMKADSAGRYPYVLSAVTISGESTISNSYVYGARNNIQVLGGNVTIENTVTESGSLANINLDKNCTDRDTVTLDNVTTIQNVVSSQYNTSKKVMGFGVVVGADATSNPVVKLKGDLKQYNWVTAADASNVSDEYAASAINAALGKTAYQHNVNGTNTANMGIIYLNEKSASILDERINKSEIPYVLNDISIRFSGVPVSGQVSSVSGSTVISADNRYDAEADGVIPYTASVNGVYKPQMRIDETLGGQYQLGVEQACYMDGDTLKVMFVDSMTLDLVKLVNISKYTNQELNLTITCVDNSGNRVDVTDGKITLLNAGEYTITYSVTDGEIYDKDGNMTGESVVYTKSIPVTATVKNASIPDARFEYNTANQKIYYSSSIGNNTQFIPFLAGLKIYDYTSGGEYLRFDGDKDFSKIAKVTLEKNTASEAEGNHIVCVELVDGGKGD